MCVDKFATCSCDETLHSTLHSNLTAGFGPWTMQTNHFLFCSCSSLSPFFPKIPFSTYITVHKYFIMLFLFNLYKTFLDNQMVVLKFGCPAGT